MRKFALLVIAALLFVVPFASAQEAEQTIADIVVASTEGDAPEFTILLAAVSAADPSILAMLSNADADLTVFAPTDAAFTAAFEALGMTAEDVLANTELLNTVLAYHVVPANVPSANLAASLEAAGDLPLVVGTALNEAALVISASDMGVMVNDANVVTADIAASNGVVHVIDAVLLPAMDDMATEEAMMATEEAMMDMGTIVDIAAGDENFSTLVTAVGAADPAVATILSTYAPITVFAPVNDAFAALPAGALDGLVADPAALTGVLALHVAPGHFSAETIVAAASADMLGGSFALYTFAGVPVTVAVTDGAVTVGGATVVTPDVYASNGIIHVIDTVILPAE